MLNRNTLFLYRESLEELLQELPDRTRCLRISCCLLGRHHSCPLPPMGGGQAALRENVRRRQELSLSLTVKLEINRSSTILKLLIRAFRAAL